MQNKYIGCLHFGCENISSQRGFKTPDEHDEFLIKKWNEYTKKDDVVYILGDISFEDISHYHKLDRLNGIKYVILGNHDLDAKELLKYVENIYGTILLENYWISHFPVHPQDLVFVEGNIHAHIHSQRVPYSIVSGNYWNKEYVIESASNEKYLNVDVEAIGYYPKTLNEIKDVFKK